jgi:hypothetical protein
MDRRNGAHARSGCRGRSPGAHTYAGRAGCSPCPHPRARGCADRERAWRARANGVRVTACSVPRSRAGARRFALPNASSANRQHLCPAGAVRDPASAGLSTRSVRRTASAGVSPGPVWRPANLSKHPVSYPRWGLSAGPIRLPTRRLRACRCGCAREPSAQQWRWQEGSGLGSGRHRRWWLGGGWCFHCAGLGPILESAKEVRSGPREAGQGLRDLSMDRLRRRGGLAHHSHCRRVRRQQFTTTRGLGAGRGARGSRRNVERELLPGDLP